MRPMDKQLKDCVIIGHNGPLISDGYKSLPIIKHIPSGLIQPFDVKNPPSAPWYYENEHTKSWTRIDEINLPKESIEDGIQCYIQFKDNSYHLIVENNQ